MGRLWQQAKGCYSNNLREQVGGVWEFDWTGCRTAPTRVFAYLWTEHTWNPNPNISNVGTSDLIMYLMDKGTPENPSSWPVPGNSTVKIQTGEPDAVMMGTLTVTNTGAGGYTTAYTCGQPVPNTSVNNYTMGQTSSNSTVVRTDANGDFCVRTTSLADIIWDKSASDTTGKIVTVGPVRTLDTRSMGYSAHLIPAVGQKVAETAVPQPAGTPVPGVVRVPTGKPNTTVLGNLTVTASKLNGYTATWPCDSARPETSSSNYLAGQTVPNFVSVRTDAKGEFCALTTAPAHLIFDVAAVSSDPAATTSPTRVADTRSFSWSAVNTPSTGTLPLGSVRPVPGGTMVSSDRTVRVQTGKPSSTFFGNLTVTGAPIPGYMTIWPCDQPRPNTSTNNHQAGQTVANFVMSRSDANGNVCISAAGKSHAILDLYGASKVDASSPTRLLDTRTGWTRG
jgi:hypothetical protein